MLRQECEQRGDTENTYLHFESPDKPRIGSDASRSTKISQSSIEHLLKAPELHNVVVVSHSFDAELHMGSSNLWGQVGTTGITQFCIKLKSYDTALG